MSETPTAGVRTFEHVATAPEVAKAPNKTWRERAQELNDRGVALAQRHNLAVQAAREVRLELERVQAELSAAKAHPILFALRRLVYRRSA